jgi:hypothetical protein
MPGFEKLWFNKVEVMRDDADTVVVGALHQAGWKRTCKTPGSVWMWEREMDGRIYRVSQDEAERIQEHFAREAYFEQYPDELSD